MIDMVDMVDEDAARVDADTDFQAQLRSTLARAWHEADRARRVQWSRRLVVLTCVLLVVLAAFGVATLGPGAADAPATVNDGSGTRAAAAPSATTTAAPSPRHPLVASLLQLEQYAPSDLPYDRALAEALGVPPNLVNAAVQALHIDGARACLAAQGVSVDDLRWFPGTTAAPSGYADAALEQLQLQDAGASTTEPGLADAAQECWDRFKVTNPLPFFDSQLPAVTAAAGDVAAAQARFRECLAQLGRTADRNAVIDQQFFDHVRDVTTAVHASTLTLGEGITQLEAIKAAEEAESALLEPCHERLDEAVQQSVAETQQAVLDDLSRPLEVPDEVTEILRELQPYLEYEP